MATLKGHTRGVEDLAVDYASRILYSCSSDTTIRKWDIKTNALLGILDGHLTSVFSINFVEGNLWSTSADNTAKRWDLEVVCLFVNFFFFSSLGLLILLWNTQIL